MSDLISKKALMEVIYQNVNPDNNGNWLKSKPLLDFIESAPAVIGEAVYLVKGSYGWIITSKESYDCTDDNYKRVAYTTPPQPQSVKDALNLHTEQVLQVFNRWMTNDGSVADYIESIRKLIEVKL